MAIVPAVLLRGVEKRFGSVIANRDATLEVAPGEIHALVGENGAGKSTLMRVLSGMYRPDGGSVSVDGRDVTGWSTAQAIEAGVGMVHQHFMLVPTLTVAENVVLGREYRRGVQLDVARAEREVHELSERSGLIVQEGRRVAELSVGEAQRVEILKTLFRGARILILDEPTAVLSPPEVNDLWNVLRRIKGDGGTIILITHKLDEVMQISDAVTVMRRGTTVARMRTAETSPAQIAHAMVGREVRLGGSAYTPSTARQEGAALHVSNLTVAGARYAQAVNDVSFTVAPGEILGVAGVEGNGQTELIEAIAGLRRITTGVIRIGSNAIMGASVQERGRLGLSHIPEDRHRRGLILDYTIAENLILGLQDRFTRKGVLRQEDIGTNAQEKIARFDIRPPNASVPARALSGGNQQKIVIAREMGREFSVLLAAQPTRGVDVGAIEFIHTQLRAARDAGKAVLLVSADLNEILELADRIMVLYRGRAVAILPRAEATEELLGRYMTGAREESA
jgi:ABC-type uncharacterized transport system ATPase subunit